MIINIRKNRGFTPVPEQSTVRGFTLLIAIVTTSLLLLVSFVVVNVALKQLVLANISEESQYAFYSAESGMECALYWDLKNPTNPGKSAFATSTASTISCNGQSPSVGGGGSNATSTFTLDFTKGCVIVSVGKSVNTIIDSRGYNTCSNTSNRRFERGVTISY